jgi:hypothetical protein
LTFSAAGSIFVREIILPDARRQFFSNALTPFRSLRRFTVFSRILTLISFATALVTCIVHNGAQAQAPSTRWSRTFGGTNIDVGFAVQQTRDSGFVVAGYTRSYGTISGRNIWLIKTDTAGTMQWNNTYGGNDDEEAYAVQQTTDGGYIMTGYTKSASAGGNDVVLIKTDSAGVQQWYHTFGGAQDEEGYSVLQTTDGGFVVAGATSTYGTAGSRDVWLIKTNSAGGELWRRSMGGYGSDGARSIQQTRDGGFIPTGWTYSYGPGAVGNVWLVKTDSAGNATWNRYFGGTDVDRGYAVRQTEDGGYIITGYTASSGAGLDDMLLIKTDSAGTAVWTRTFGGTGRDYGNALEKTADGGYIIAGYTLSYGAGGDDVWLVKTDANGTLRWSATYGGTASDVGYDVKQTFDGGYVVAGHTLSSGAGVHDVWLIRVNPELTESVGPTEGVHDFRLLQNYPNPFNPSTTISYSLPRSAHVRLAVYDLLGRSIVLLVDADEMPGLKSVQFDGRNIPSGVYFCRLQAGGYVATNKILLVR